MNEPDPLIVAVWKHLVSIHDAETVAAFFQQWIVNGREVLEEIHAREFASLLSTLGTVEASGSTDLPSLAEAASPRAAPAGAAAEPLDRRPHTQVNLARHMEILERKWLVTGYVLMLRTPGCAVRRIPLNFRRVRIGTAGAVAQDIELEMPPGMAYQARLELHEGRFVLHHEGGNVPTVHNGIEVVMVPVNDRDTVSIGFLELRFFKLIEPAAELHIASGPNAGERYVLDISEVRLGRPGKRINDIDLPSSTVSREHATVMFHERKFWLIPEATSSPTAINGVPIMAATVLSDNDQIVLGEQTLLFKVRGGVRPSTLEERTATVLFSDLRGWTTVAESTPLQDFITQVNEYYDAMGEVIHRYGGTLITYQGDAIMAIFGAPSKHADDPWRAVAAALRMLEEMETLNAKWESEGKSALRGGIGIHTGNVMVGELGHASRREYSAVGDATNLAARLEQLTKEYQCPLIISDVTYREVESLAEATQLGTVTVKGRSAPTEIYQILSLSNV